MRHLLLVSIQVMIPIMTLFDSTKELISIKGQNNSKINLTSEKDPILCNHCKRTASNGVRCLGMCVADNDCLLYTSPSPRDYAASRMPSSA